MRRHLLRFATLRIERRSCALQQVRRRGRRRAQSASARGGLAPSLKMVPPAKISAENHSQAGAARPRAGPETIVRLAAYIYTRVNGMCGICERGTVLHINIEGVLHSTAPRVPFSLSFYIRIARRGPFDGQRRARLGQREPFLAG